MSASKSKSHVTKSKSPKSSHVEDAPKTEEVSESKQSHPHEPAHASVESAPTAQQEAQPTTGTATDVATQAANAIATLRSLAGTLPIDDSLTPTQVKQVRGTNRVPLALLSIAAGVLAEDPDRFPDFSATTVQSGVDYEAAMVPLVVETRAFADSVERSVQKQRSGAAQQSLALYAAMKGVSRIPANEKTRSQVKQMAALLTTNRKKRETSVTQAETKQFEKVAKAAKVANVKSTKAADAAQEAANAAAQAQTTAAANADVIPQAPTPSPTTQPPAPAPSAPSPTTIPPTVGH